MRVGLLQIRFQIFCFHYNIRTLILPAAVAGGGGGGDYWGGPIIGVLKFLGIACRIMD